MKHPFIILALLFISISAFSQASDSDEGITEINKTNKYTQAITARYLKAFTKYIEIQNKIEGEISFGLLIKEDLSNPFYNYLKNLMKNESNSDDSNSKDSVKVVLIKSIEEVKKYDFVFMDISLGISMKESLKNCIEYKTVFITYKCEDENYMFDIYKEGEKVQFNFNQKNLNKISVKASHQLIPMAKTIVE